jgi:hypothetical protein
MARPRKTPVEPIAAPADCTVTNCLPGTRLSLGDGRAIEHGESAEVSPEIATFLRDRGQVA